MPLLVALPACIVLPIPIPQKHTASAVWADPATAAHRYVKGIRDGTTRESTIRDILGLPSFVTKNGVAAYTATLKTGEMHVVAAAASFEGGSSIDGKLYDCGTRYLLLLQYNRSGVVQRHALRELALSTPQRRLEEIAQEWGQAQHCS